MERVLSAEEKIRRAEEIYERRKSQNYRNTTATVNVSGRSRDYNLLKKMLIQILICLLIYFIFYLIQTTNYVFSASTINKTKEILNYDMDVKGIYNGLRNNFVNEQNKEENNLENNINDENINEMDENNQENENIEENTTDEQSIQENNLEEENTEINQENKEEANIEQLNDEEENITVAQKIINNYSIIKPAEGFISSEFGTREEEGDIVTSYHNGIDIGVVTGTDVKSATDGEVIWRAESSSYGNYIKIKNGDLVTLYAHCSELLANVGDSVKQGDIIAKSGATGNVTGPHLHFEIIYQGEYVNPRDILEF